MRLFPETSPHPHSDISANNYPLVIFKRGRPEEGGGAVKMRLKEKTGEQCGDERMEEKKTEIKIKRRRKWRKLHKDGIR